MWYHQATIYQIYPLGLCGAPQYNDGIQSHRILRILEWMDPIAAIGADTVLFNPLFESDRHGYDTRDYRKVDCRLGTNRDLKTVCDALHAKGIRILFDAVLNHVGRGFWAFQDVLQKRWDSPYKDWFHISFDGNNSYNDGLWYEAWEGHEELVKLNLSNPAVIQHQFEAIRSWVEDYGIDGLRLDVAYCLPDWYLKQLRSFTDSLKEDFVLIGETIHGDYKRWMGPEMCHSTTNYECYKGLHSALNSMNLFEIGHSLARQFGPENWTLYRGCHLLNFLDNHDVTRIASMLQNPNHLPVAYGLLFGMPGVPAIYYGSEWGIQGKKGPYDLELRPEVEKPIHNELTDWIFSLSEARRKSRALCEGDFRNIVLTNRQIIFQREVPGERVLVAINADEIPYVAHFDAKCGMAEDLITGKPHDFGGGSELPPYSVAYWRMER